MENTIDLATCRSEARSFRQQFSSVMLATTSADGIPEASYAPVFFDDQERPCIYVSELAQHGKNLLQNPIASLLFIEDEKAARNLFARRRITLRCEAEEIQPDSPAGSELLDRFEARFGRTAALLRTLGDFHLIRFRVVDGCYVRGFGQAYTIADASLKIPPLTDR